MDGIPIVLRDLNKNKNRALFAHIMQSLTLEYIKQICLRRTAFLFTFKLLVDQQIGDHMLQTSRPRSLQGLICVSHDHAAGYWPALSVVCQFYIYSTIDSISRSEVIHFRHFYFCLKMKVMFSIFHNGVIFWSWNHVTTNSLSQNLCSKSLFKIYHASHIQPSLQSIFRHEQTKSKSKCVSILEWTGYKTDQRHKHLQLISSLDCLGRISNHRWRH